MQTQFETNTVAGVSTPSSHFPLAYRKQNLVVSAITMLSDQDIELMNREDVLDVLRMARSHCPLSEEKNFLNMNVTELRRVLAIVREYFRKQMNRQSPAKTWSPEFN